MNEYDPNVYFEAFVKGRFDLEEHKACAADLLSAAQLAVAKYFEDNFLDGIKHGEVRTIPVTSSYLDLDRLIADMSEIGVDVSVYIRRV